MQGSVPRRYVGWIMVLAIGTYAFGFALDVAGGRKIEREQLKWQDATSRQRELLRAFRRRLVVGDPLEQNAAIWYRLAFERLRPRTADIHRELLPIVQSAMRPAADATERAYSNWCTEADSARIRTAFACTQCDWEISYDFDRDQSADDVWFEAMVLAECLTVDGLRRLDRHDWSGSAKTFLTTLSAATDFAQGPLQLNVIAVSVGQWALRGFAEAISRIDDLALIQRFAGQFAQLEPTIPSFQVGLKQQQLSRAVQATSLARAYIRDHRNGIRIIFPWRAVAAWRLSQEEKRVSRVSLLTSRSNPGERSRVVAELSQPGPLSAPIVPSTLDDAFKQEDRLGRAVQAARAAIELQGSYAGHAEYPSTIPGGEVRHLRYETIERGKGYRLRTVSETGVLEPFLERAPDVQSR